MNTLAVICGSRIHCLAFTRDNTFFCTCRFRSPDARRDCGLGAYSAQSQCVGGVSGMVVGCCLTGREISHPPKGFAPKVRMRRSGASIAKPGRGPEIGFIEELGGRDGDDFSLSSHSRDLSFTYTKRAISTSAANHFPPSLPSGLRTPSRWSRAATFWQSSEKR